MNRLSSIRLYALLFTFLSFALSSCRGIQTKTNLPDVVFITTTPNPIETDDEPPKEPESQDIKNVIQSLDGLSLDDFFERSYTELLMRNPEYLTESGLATIWGLRNDQLNNLSSDYIKDTQTLQSNILQILRTYDRAELSREDKLSLEVYEWYLDDLVRGHEFMYHNYPVHHFLMSYHDNLIRLLTELHPMTSKEDVEDYIARLSRVEDQIAQLMQGLTIREELGIVPPDFILRMAINGMSDYIGIRSSGSASLDGRNLSVYTIFLEKLGDIEGLREREKNTFLEQVLEAIETSFIPGYMELIRYLGDLTEVTSSDAGVWKFPNGDDFYEYILRHQTQTEMTPEEIHQLGLAEVDRITAEMKAIFDDLDYPSDEDFGDLINRAAYEGGFFELTTQGLIDNYVSEIEVTLGEIDKQLDDVFDIRPIAEVIVIGDLETGGFYVPASIDGSRPGAYHAYVGMDQTAKYVMPTVAFHEAIPGHHFQIAIAQELNLPLFRNDVFFNGYGEGWALYAEMLAFEMGMYDGDPYGNLGRLQFELLRAVRLVVDTGIHAMKWSRDEARQYMDDTLGIPGRFSHEVERYIVLPGQAVGYKLGMLKIVELREKAMIELGDDFDIMEFHRVVLGNGSVPLEILAELVDEYIAAKGEG